MGPDGGEIKFELDEFKKHCLLNGLDDVALTMEHEEKISGYEETLKVSEPWLFG